MLPRRIIHIEAKCAWTRISRVEPDLTSRDSKFKAPKCHFKINRMYINIVVLKTYLTPMASEICRCKIFLCSTNHLTAITSTLCGALQFAGLFAVKDGAIIVLMSNSSALVSLHDGEETTASSSLALGDSEYDKGVPIDSLSLYVDGNSDLNRLIEKAWM